jgi:hypothetical protein
MDATGRRSRGLMLDRTTTPHATASMNATPGPSTREGPVPPPVAGNEHEQDEKQTEREQ